MIFMLQLFTTTLGCAFLIYRHISTSTAHIEPLEMNFAYIGLFYNPFVVILCCIGSKIKNSVLVLVVACTHKLQ